MTAVSALPEGFTRDSESGQLPEGFARDSAPQPANSAASPSVALPQMSMVGMAQRRQDAGKAASEALNWAAKTGLPIRDGMAREQRKIEQARENERLLAADKQIADAHKAQQQPTVSALPASMTTGAGVAGMYAKGNGIDVVEPAKEKGGIIQPTLSCLESMGTTLGSGIASLGIGIGYAGEHYLARPIRDTITDIWKNVAGPEIQMKPEALAKWRSEQGQDKGVLESDVAESEASMGVKAGQQALAANPQSIPVEIANKLLGIAPWMAEAAIPVIGLPLVAATAAGSTAQETKERGRAAGWSDQQAENASLAAGIAGAALMVIPMGSTLRLAQGAEVRLGEYIGEGIFRQISAGVQRAPAAITKNALTFALANGVQEGIVEVASGEPIDLASISSSAISGAEQGGLLGAAGHALGTIADITRFRKEVNAPKPEVPKAEPAPPVSKTETPAKPDTPDVVIAATGNKTKPVEGEAKPSLTSIKNRVVDEERAQRGLPPMETLLRQKWEDANDKAASEMDANPARLSGLIQELIDKPRPTSDVEGAMLDRARVDLNHTRSKLLESGIAAHEAGDTGALVQNRIQLSIVNADLEAVDQAGKNAGSELGRGLAFRRAMMAEDYSLVSVEQQWRAANRFEPLPEAKIAEIKRLTDELTTLQAKYDEHVRQTEANQRAAAMLTIKARTQTPRAANPSEPAFGGRNRIFTRERADAAKAVLAEKLSQLNLGLDPTLLKPLTEVGGYYLEAGLREFGAWSKAVMESLGEHGKKIEQFLPRIFEEASKTETDTKLAAIGAKMDKASAAGRVLLEQTGNLRELERMFAEQGITEPGPMIDAVHDFLKGIEPEITKRDVSDALSGYGKFRQLSKDEISARIRDINGRLQQMAKLQDMAEGTAPAKTGFERRTPTDAERELIKMVNDAKRQGGYNTPDPATQLKSALQSLKTRWTNQLTDLTKKLDEGDFSRKPPKSPVELDKEAQSLKVAVEDAKSKIKRGELEIAAKNRTKAEKTLDTIVKWRRGFVLSSPIVLAKLTSAAIERMVFTPMEQVVGAGLRKLPGVRDIAARAPSEGGASIRVEANAIAEGFSKAMTDISSMLKHGEMDIGKLYGKEHFDVAPSFMDYIGRLHGALKTVPKRAAFTRSMAYRTEAAIRMGLDPTDPMVQVRLSIEAYKDANRSIFLQDNWLTQRWKKFTLPTIDKATGKEKLGSKVFTTAARVALPIVSIPTNIVAETLTYTFGTFTGSARLAAAFIKGIDTLKPEEADLIMRQLKKGSLGLAAMAIGYFNSENIGGYYQPGEKRKEGDVAADEARVFGVTIPRYLMHHPLLMTMQIGATVKRIMNSKLRKSDAENRSVVDAGASALLGLIQEVPLAKEGVDLAKLFGPAAQRDQVAQDTIRSLLIPAASQWTAGKLDTDAQGKPIKRKATTLKQALEEGIPGLRSNVPRKKP